MQEIDRSRNMASLVARKRFLEDNDIPCRIFLEGTDITDIPSHPVFGLAYHLEEDASLVVDDEDARRAFNLLYKTEHPVGLDDDLDAGEDPYYDAPPRHLGATIWKTLFFIFYLFLSAVWLYYAFDFLSPLWATRSSSTAWDIDSSLVPIGVAMIAVWGLFLLMLLISGRREK